MQKVYKICKFKEKLEGDDWEKEWNEEIIFEIDLFKY